MSQQRGFGGDSRRKFLFQRFADALMELDALLLEQRLIRGVLNERMFERVDGSRRRPFLKQDFGTDQFFQLALQRDFVQARHREQHLISEPPPDGRSELSHVVDALQPIEPRDQQVLQRRGDRFQLEAFGEFHAAVDFSQRSGFENQRRVFLDEQRHPFGAFNDLHDDLGRNLSQPSPLDHHFFDLLFRQPIERELRLIGSTAPRRFEFRAERQQRQQPVVQALIEQLAEQLQRRRIDPVQVLDDEQQRRLSAVTADQMQQRGECLLHHLHRTESQRRIPTLGRDRQQRREQRHRFRVRDDVLIEMFHQPIELAGGGRFGIESQHAAERFRCRIKSRVREERRRSPFDDLPVAALNNVLGDFANQA